jgi:hypothetical protein
MRLALASILLAVTAAAHSQISTESPFLGTWENPSPTTREVRRLEISQVGAALRLRLWMAAGGLGSMADAGTFDAQVFNPTAVSLPRNAGPVVRVQTRLSAQTVEILVEQAPSNQLKVTYLVIEGPQRGKVERAQFRKVVPAEDCLRYDPATVRIDGPRIMAGRSILMAFSDARDRDLGVTLARSYARMCTIGRGNVRPDRAKYVFEYWDGGANGATAPSSDCNGYDPARLRIMNAGADGYRIESPTGSGYRYLQIFDTLADAQAALPIYRAHTQQCWIARGTPDFHGYLR